MVAPERFQSSVLFHALQGSAAYGLNKKNRQKNCKLTISVINITLRVLAGLSGVTINKKDQILLPFWPYLVLAQLS